MFQIFENGEGGPWKDGGERKGLEGKNPNLLRRFGGGGGVLRTQKQKVLRRVLRTF